MHGALQPVEDRHGDGAAAESSGPRIHQFAAAVANHELWCYMEMLRGIMSVLQHLMYWVQSCPCHIHKETR